MTSRIEGGATVAEMLQFLVETKKDARLSREAAGGQVILAKKIENRMVEEARTIQNVMTFVKIVQDVGAAAMKAVGAGQAAASFDEAMPSTEQIEETLDAALETKNVDTIMEMPVPDRPGLKVSDLATREEVGELLTGSMSNDEIIDELSSKWEIDPFKDDPGKRFDKLKEKGLELLEQEITRYPEEMKKQGRAVGGRVGEAKEQLALAAQRSRDANEEIQQLIALAKSRLPPPTV